jgi:hypothetical protein
MVALNFPRSLDVGTQLHTRWCPIFPPPFSLSPATRCGFWMGKSCTGCVCVYLKIAVVVAEEEVAMTAAPLTAAPPLRETAMMEAAGTDAIATMIGGMEVAAEEVAGTAEAAAAIADATRIPGAMTTEGDTAAAAAVMAALPREAGMTIGDMGVEATMTGEAAGTAATVTPSPGVMKTGAAMLGGAGGLLEVGITLHAIEALRAAAMVAADPRPADTPLPAAVALLPGARACCVARQCILCDFFLFTIALFFFGDTSTVVVYLVECEPMLWSSGASANTPTKIPVYVGQRTLLV